MKIKHDKSLCVECKTNKSGFIYKGRWKRDEDHDLCNRCYISTIDKAAAGDLSRNTRTINTNRPRLTGPDVKTKS